MDLGTGKAGRIKSIILSTGTLFFCYIHTFEHRNTFFFVVKSMDLGTGTLFFFWLNPWIWGISVPLSLLWGWAPHLQLIPCFFSARSDSLSTFEPLPTQQFPCKILIPGPAGQAEQLHIRNFPVCAWRIRGIFNHLSAHIKLTRRGMCISL